MTRLTMSWTWNSFSEGAKDIRHGDVSGACDSSDQHHIEDQVIDPSCPCQVNRQGEIENASDCVVT